MGMDPAGVNPNDPRTFNRFAYANNNPYRYVDPDGKFAIPLFVLPFIGGGVTVTATDVAIGGLVAAAVTIPGDAVRNENAGNNDSGASKSNSNKKRKAAREAQRKQGTPTSIPGNNQQGKPGTPRHQIKPGSDGQATGVVDGSNDTVDGHGPHIEVGDIKSGDLTNKYGQPRLKNGKSKVDY